jgi:hypothetical protein
MGNFLTEKTWAKSAEKLVEPKKVLNNHRLDISQSEMTEITSCDDVDCV